MTDLEQIGDYLIERKSRVLAQARGRSRHFWIVRMAGAEECLSQYNTKTEARAAIRRYQAARKKAHQSLQV